MRHYSPRTERAYVGWVRRFILFHGKRHPRDMGEEEVSAFLSALRGSVWLMASLMYGAGLRLLECAELRVKDVDLVKGEIRIRDGKGRKDRVTMLPARLREPLEAHLERVRQLHATDLAAGRGRVALPDALARKYPGANREWRWQWVFPATRTYRDDLTGEGRRHHLHQTVVQRAVGQAAARAGLTKRATCHTLRHHADSLIVPPAA
jgi:integrase